MTYTELEERVAQRRLRDIYNKKNRKQRIELAERLGYGGKDSSKLRNLRRLTAQVIPADRTVNLNRYYRPFSTDTDPAYPRNPWRGTYPDVVAGPTTAKRTEHGEKQLYHVYASVMAVAIFPDDAVISYSRNLNTKGKIGETSDPGYSDDIRFLLDKFGRDAALKYSPPTDGGEVLPASGKLIAMAFNPTGAIELDAYLRKRNIDVGIPEAEGGKFGIALVPSTQRKMDNVRVYSYQRSFPKAKRDDIIRYTNYAKGPMGVS